MFLKQFSIESPILKPMWNCRMHIKNKYFFVFSLGGKCVMKFIEIAKTMLFHCKKTIFLYFSVLGLGCASSEKNKKLWKNSDFINMHLSRKCWIATWKDAAVTTNPAQSHTQTCTHTHARTRTHTHASALVQNASFHKHGTSPLAPTHTQTDTHTQIPAGP